MNFAYCYIFLYFRRYQIYILFLSGYYNNLLPGSPCEKFHACNVALSLA